MLIFNESFYGKIINSQLTIIDRQQKMSTYKATFKSLLNQGLSIHYGQNKSETIIKCSKPAPCSYPESQTGLYLDISLRENSKNQQNWASFENHLKELFDQILQLEQYPNSSIKISIFIIEEGSDIKACIINALWFLFLKMGINMKKSIYCLQQSSHSNQNNSMQTQNSFTLDSGHCVIYNLNDPESVIYGEMSAQEINNQQENSGNLQEELKKYKNFILQTFRATLFN